MDVGPVVSLALSVQSNQEHASLCGDPLVHPPVHRHDRCARIRGSRLRRLTAPPVPPRPSASPSRLLLDPRHRRRPLHVRARLGRDSGNAAGHHHDQGHAGDADADDLRRPLHLARARRNRYRQQRPLVEPGQLDEDRHRAPLLSPAPGATITYPSPVLLQWAPVDGAYQYVVSIADSSNMANAVSATTEATSFSPGSWLPPGVHYWTVTAKDARGNPVGTSPRSAPARPSPGCGLRPSRASSVTSAIDASAGATAQWTMYDPQFSWTPVPGAVKYQVEVNTDDISWSAGSKVCCYGHVRDHADPQGPAAQRDVCAGACGPSMPPATPAPGRWEPISRQSYDSFVTAPPSTPSVPNLRMADNLQRPRHRTSTSGTAGYQTQVPVVKWDAVPGASATTC